MTTKTKKPSKHLTRQRGVQRQRPGKGRVRDWPVVNMYLKPELCKALESWVKDSGISRNAYLTRVIEKHLQDGKPMVFS